MEIKEIQIQCDYETPDRAGAAGTFQVVGIIVKMDDGSTKDLSNKIDAGKFYYSHQELLDELKLDIADELIEWI